MFVAAVKDPFEIPASAGVPASTLSTTLVAHCNDIAHVRELLDEHRGGGDHPGAGRRPLDDGADQSRVSQGAARGDEEARRHPDLRRGRDGLPTRRRRRAGILRRDGRSHLPGQGGGRRLARRRAGRARRSHGQHRLQRRRQARPHQARGRSGDVQRHAAGGGRRRRPARDPQDRRGPARAEPQGRHPARRHEPGAQDARRARLRVRRIVRVPHLPRAPTPPSWGSRTGRWTPRAWTAAWARWPGRCIWPC